MITEFTEGNEFLAEYLKNRSYIYLSVITNEFAEMAHNWFISLKNINQHNNALVIALDRKCYDELLSYNIPCVFLDAGIKSNKSMSEWIENEKAFKMAGILHIVEKYKMSFIYSDVDIVFLKDPTEKLKETIVGHDFVLMSDKRFDPFVTKRKLNELIEISSDKKIILNHGQTHQSKIGTDNAGFCYLEITPEREESAKKFVDCYKVFYKDSPYFENHDKGIETGDIQSLSIKRYKESGLKLKVLNTFEFVNGSIWKVPYLNKRVKDTCYIVHYNFTNEGTPQEIKNNKIEWMKQNNHWYL
jgi:hypothetical protein